MTTYIYEHQTVTVVKPLNIKDKYGEWVQIEILDGENKGMRMPVSLKRLHKE
jgi:hypothetical protein